MLSGDPTLETVIWSAGQGQRGRMGTVFIRTGVMSHEPSNLGGYMQYKVAVHRSEEGYSVSVPGLPGCWSQGTTEEEALANIQDAIIEYLAARDELLGREGFEVRDAGLTPEEFRKLL